MFQRRYCRVCDAGSLQTSNGLLPRLVCCLGRLLNLQLCRGAIIVVKGAGGGCCFENRGKASFRGLLRQKASCDCILDQCLDARLGCDECS